MAKVNLDKLQATSNGNIENVVVGTTALHNGALVALGAKVTGQFDQLAVAAPTSAAELLLVAAPEVKYAENAPDELDILNETGKVVRAYHLTVGDKFKVEQSLFAATPVVGTVVTGNATFGYAVGTGRTTFMVEEIGTYWADARPTATLRVLTV